MTDPWPKDYGRPALRKSLASFETREAMPGYVGVKAVWRFQGVAHYGDAMVDGKPVAMFRMESTDYPAPWVTMALWSFEAFKRVWGVA